MLAFLNIKKYIKRMNVFFGHSDLNKVNQHTGHPWDAVIGCPFANTCRQVQIPNGPSSSSIVTLKQKIIQKLTTHLWTQARYA